MLVIEPCGGLGNRIRAINSAIFLAQKVNTSLTLVWKVKKEMGIHVGDLFELPSFVRVYSFTRFDLFSKCMTKRIKKKAKKVILQEEMDLLMGKNYNFENLPLTETVYIKTSSNFYPYTHLEYFKLIPLLQSKIDRYISCFDRNIIGVHIRRTDNEMAKKYSSLQSFIKVMQEEIDSNPNTKFFLATDSPEEEKEIIRTFPGRIITHSKILSRSSKNGIQDAIIDLFCLANTNKLYASYYSSFSDIATQINNIPKIVVTENTK